ncbi:hypothetical protein HUS70_17055 [Pandoraea nosoerga]|nr:hypothetical protein [Pandoraea nosoerga]MBN4667187.1 hypothetical protein [Pandoraea nosoerga]MBN4677174.1 hypothetical protein [Pandoraea nosoerga]MBN4682005.1 hypothetical protein [Pandoraea nosoerga]MBN4746323.1 hypothetical protein [Pandoraea nosoerga]
MRQRKNRRALIRPTALGGYTLDGPHYRHRGLRQIFQRLFAWLGGAR